MVGKPRAKKRFMNSCEFICLNFTPMFCCAEVFGIKLSQIPFRRDSEMRLFTAKLSCIKIQCYSCRQHFFSLSGFLVSHSNSVSKIIISQPRLRLINGPYSINMFVCQDCQLQVTGRWMRQIGTGIQKDTLLATSTAVSCQISVISLV